MAMAAMPKLGGRFSHRSDVDMNQTARYCTRPLTPPQKHGMRGICAPSSQRARAGAESLPVTTRIPLALRVSGCGSSKPNPSGFIGGFGRDRGCGFETRQALVCTPFCVMDPRSAESAADESRANLRRLANSPGPVRGSLRATETAPLAGLAMKTPIATVRNHQ